ncbi:MAG: hypothetical protein GX224_03370 [Thermoplasmatales archaeon]|nr:hypothetical protein [Thermoplasmatales archaeon]
MVCIYCKKEVPGDYCCEKHREACGRWLEHVEKWKYVFLACLAISLVAGLALLAFTQSHFPFLVMIGGAGATILVFPFTTPETATALGLRKSIALGRWIGVAFVAVAAVDALCRFV